MTDAGLNPFCFRSRFRPTPDCGCEYCQSVLIPFASGHDSDYGTARPCGATQVLIPFASGHDSDLTRRDIESLVGS